MLEEQKSNLPEPPLARTLSQLAELQSNAQAASQLPAGISAHRDWFDAKAVEAMPTATRRAYMAALRGIFSETSEGKTNNDLLVSFSPRAHGDSLPPDAIAIPKDMAEQEDALMRRIRALDEAGKSVSSMRLAVAAVNAVRKAMRLPAVPREIAIGVGNVAKSRKASQPKQSAPIRAEDMDAIERAADQRRWRESVEGAIKRRDLDRAMILVARDGLMRVSELANATLDNMAVRINGSAVLTFERAKRGGTASAYLSAATVEAVEAVQRPEGERRIIPLGERQILRRMKAAAEAGGVKGASTHGCRVGMAQDLAEAGATGEQLKQVGSWKSDRMVQHYVREQEAPRNAVAQFYKRQG